MASRPPTAPSPYAPPLAPLEPAGSPPGEAVFRPLGGLARAWTVVMAITALLDLAGLINAAITAAAMKRVVAGEDVPMPELEAIDQRSSMMAMVYMVAVIAGLVVFCMIMVRANRNARSFNNMHLQMTPGWAAGFFFVPILSLWKPYQAMREIWQASSTIRYDLRVPGLIPLWWATFLLHSFAGQATLRVTSAAKDAEGLLLAAQVDIVSAVLTIIAAVVSVMLVQALAVRQDQRPVPDGTAVPS